MRMLGFAVAGVYQDSQITDINGHAWLYYPPTGVVKSGRVAKRRQKGALGKGLDKAVNAAMWLFSRLPS